MTRGFSDIVESARCLLALAHDGFMPLRGATPRRIVPTHYPGRNAVMCNSFVPEPLEPRLQFAATPLLPDMTAFASKTDGFVYGWTLDTSKPGHTLLRLTHAVGNIGAGPLELFGGAFKNGKQLVYQRILRSDGTHYTRKVGTFSAQDDNEVYFDGFAQFSLAMRSKGNSIGKIIRKGIKRTCCVLDDVQVKPKLKNSPTDSKYTTCSAKKQGLSVGWADIYDKSLQGQWIDITGIKRGSYWLQVTANPDLNILESNTKNNTVRIPIVIK
jgi:hypothetical protein